MSEVPRYPKRLIEVDLPIRRISTHARREKSIRHGHISTLHIWWARRPLAACRAVLCAALWPDPADESCPQVFRETAKREMVAWAKEHLKLLSAESYPRFNAIARTPHRLDEPTELRNALLDFIADFSNWDSSTMSEFLVTSRALTQAAHEALGGDPSTRPLVVDPFAGGGAIPLESIRIGADAFASDLNPVPVLLNKVALEYVPMYGEKLSTEVRRWGEWIQKEAAEELRGLYPTESDGEVPIAYLWARTVRCEGPGCGVEIPLIRSLLLRRDNPRVALRIEADRAKKALTVDVVENAELADVGPGTVRRGAAICPICQFTTPAPRVRLTFKTRRGGAADARLLGVISTRPGRTGRSYRSARPADIAATQSALARLEASRSAHPEVFPTEPLPYLRSIFNIKLLYTDEWQDLFTPRQLLSLVTLVQTMRRAVLVLGGGLEAEFRNAVATCVALAIDRQADYNSSLCRWVPAGEFIGNTFGRQALGIIWDFAEVNPFGNGSGNFDGAISWVAGVCENLSRISASPGYVERASATQHPLPDDSASAFITDPPYYDAVPYADLADFFFVWLKRSLAGIHPTLLVGELTPKELEVVQLAERNKDYAYKTRENFESLMREALNEGRRVTRPSGIGVIVFAHKSTTAWESMLQAVLDSGWIIVASWPIDTEMGARLRAKNSATLSSSVHLVCRPREDADGRLAESEIGSWRDVLRELPVRIHQWMPRLAQEGVVGADAIFACLGPALEVFSRYSRVEKTSGDVVALGEYLEHVWAAVSKEALSMIFDDAETSGLEPDARLTAMWLWTLAGPTGVATEETEADRDDVDEDEAAPTPKSLGFSLEYDAARKIAQGLGARLEELPSVVEVKGSMARLLSVGERARGLFAKAEQAPSAAERKTAKKKQLTLFEEQVEMAAEEQGWGASGAPTAGKTVLDRVHQAMLLFGTGRGEALKRFLVEEGAGRQGSFWKLAQALSALYPSGCDEKRWVDGVLARKKALGF